MAQYPGARLLVVGPGDAAAARERMAPEVAAASEFLGAVSDADKASLLASVDLASRPTRAGRASGSCLVEAMSAGAPVVASDLPAFLRVLDGGRAGATFQNEDAEALAAQVVRLAGDPAARAELAARGHSRARVFDWSVVAEDVMAVYLRWSPTVPGLVRTDATDTRWTRLLRRGGGGDD